MAPQADLMYACDGAWWDTHHEATQAFAGERWTQDLKAAQRYGLHHITSRREHGLSRTPGVIHQGGNSGYQAIDLMVQMGCTRILLLGFDMQKTGGKAHWFGNHPGNLHKASPFKDFIKNFERMAVDAAGLGIEIINCSRETALTCFPRARLKDVL